MPPLNYVSLLDIGEALVRAHKDQRLLGQIKDHFRVYRSQLGDAYDKDKYVNNGPAVAKVRDDFLRNILDTLEGS